MMGLRLKMLALAGCLACSAASVPRAEAGGQGRGGRGGGHAQGATQSADGGGQRGGRAATPGDVPANGTAAPQRFTAGLVGPALPSRPIGPFSDMLHPGRRMWPHGVATLFDPFWYQGFSSSDQPDETPPSVVPYATLPPAAAIRSAYPEPSSIQSQGPRLEPPRPPDAATGSLQFDVQPPTAQAFVDGFSVGSVDEVNARGGLTLTAGWHRLELRAAGHQTAAVNLTIEAFRTITQRLVLRRNP